MKIPVNLQPLSHIAIIGDMARPAVFIDRDGTLNEEVGYMNHALRLHLIPGAAEAVRMLSHEGIAVVVVTNQAGVARGYFPEIRVVEANDRMRALLQAENAKVDGIYYCPHHPDVSESPYRMNCDCRKPKPGMLYRAAKELDLDLSKSYAVGDRGSDISLGRNGGTKVVFVKTGYGLGEWEYSRDEWKHQPDHVAEDLLEAVRWILDDMRGRNILKSE
jgi:D-glycero-D-manno-heptose 1,7-bisphosphate phosphatase